MIGNVKLQLCSLNFNCLKIVSIDLNTIKNTAEEQVSLYHQLSQNDAKKISSAFRIRAACIFIFLSLFSRG